MNELLIQAGVTFLAGFLGAVLGTRLPQRTKLVDKPAVAVAVVPTSDFTPAPLPAVVAKAGIDPVDKRPDSSAEWNVFRLDKQGRLQLADDFLYYGNDQKRAERAMDAYKASEDWTGNVYAFRWTQCVEKEAR